MGDGFEWMNGHSDGKAHLTVWQSSSGQQAGTLCRSAINHPRPAGRMDQRCPDCRLAESRLDTDRRKQADRREAERQEPAAPDQPTGPSTS